MRLILFEDPHARDFYPLTEMRPVWELRTGLGTLRQRIEWRLGLVAEGGLCRGALQPVAARLGLPLPELAEDDDILMVNGRLLELDADDVLPSWEDVILQTAQAVRQERASEVFLDILGQLLAGGQAVIDDDMRNPREYPPGVTVVGYRDDHFIYLLPEIALKAVNHVQPLNFSANAIGNMLKEDDLLLPGNLNLTVQRRVRGGRVRLWQLKSDIWACDGCDDETQRR